MKVTKDGNVYKLARISGPKHNFLGLTLSGAEVPSLTIERLQVDDGGVYAGTLDEQQLVEAVQLLRSLLEELGLIGFLKTTGGKGLHVVVPIRASLSWEQAKRFAKATADLMVHTYPDRFIATASKSRREGLIFVDHLRNAQGATAVCAYSPRARANAPVATPITWEELDRDVRFDHFNVRSVPVRLDRMKADPWAGFFDVKQSVGSAMLKRMGVR